jgi:hypothetical protein
MTVFLILAGLVVFALLFVALYVWAGLSIFDDPHG